MDLAHRPEAQPRPRDSLAFMRQGRPYRTTFETLFNRFGGGGSSLELDGGDATGNNASFIIDGGGA
jgi:hypothetical protein